jgi:hypothetical protein
MPTPKSSHIARLAGVSLLALAGSASAQVAPNNPVGLWVVNWSFDDSAPMAPVGTQTICFLANGTWYSTSYSGWNGLWFQKGNSAAGNGDHVSLNGNYAANVGNDVFQLDFVHVDLMTGPWTEWRDNFVSHYWVRSAFTRKGRCAALAPNEEKAMLDKAAQDRSLEKSDPIGAAR